MKKLLVMIMVLAMATIANAALKISVNGLVDPADTEITLQASQTVVIDVWSDGTDLADAPAFLVVSGPASLDITGAINTVVPPGYPDSIFIWEGDPANGAVFMDVAIPEMGALIPAGTIIDGIIFHCDDIGDVTLSLYLDRTPIGGIFELMDTQIIHQPEPITIALLGLGGLFLRRRK